MIFRFHTITAFVITALAGFLPLRGANADRYLEYIDHYAPLAIEQMDRYGIPASITLAQGLLESAAGRSTLASDGNNHFGIKCHSGWQGESMLRDDDAPDECFRVYASASESFEDHSLFLTRKRYQSLFDLPADDYASWAKGLKKCGYATDPNYAERLISIIERYALYGYDTSSGRMAEETAAFILDQLRSSHVVRRSRGLHYVIANPGDTYRSIATEFGIDPAKLLLFNDADDADSEIKPWEEVYFQEKHANAPENVSKATIGQDESMHSLAQRFGMKLSSLQALNPKAKNKPGERLKLK